MRLTLNKFRKITNLKKKLNFKDFDLINNYGLFCGDHNLFKTLQIFELIKRTKNIKGDIIELGIHNGNTSLLIKKILDIYKIKKKLFLLDHFKGLTTYDKKDTSISKKFYGKYKGNKKKIKIFLNFFNFKNIKFLDIDASKIKKSYFKKSVFSLAYFDMDLYSPTIKALEAINKNMSLGSLIVFDQGHKKMFAERLAIKDFLKNNKNYKKIILDNERQPDIILKKIKY